LLRAAARLWTWQELTSYASSINWGKGTQLDDLTPERIVTVTRSYSGTRTTNTEQGAFQATLLETLPKTLCFMSVAPVAPTTRRS